MIDVEEKGSLPFFSVMAISVMKRDGTLQASSSSELPFY